MALIVRKSQWAAPWVGSRSAVVSGSVGRPDWRWEYFSSWRYWMIVPRARRRKLEAPRRRRPRRSRYVPSQDLIFLLEFDGLDAQSAAWRGSAAFKLLNETKLGTLLENLATQVIDQALESAPPNKRSRPATLSVSLSACRVTDLSLRCGERPPTICDSFSCCATGTGPDPAIARGRGCRRTRARGRSKRRRASAPKIGANALPGGPQWYLVGREGRPGLDRHGLGQ